MKKRSSRKKRWLKRLLYLSAFFLVVGYILVDHVAPYMILQPERRIAADHPEWYPQGITPEDHGMKGAHHTIVTRDSVLLDGIYIPTHLDSSRGTFLLLHGIGSNKEQWFSLCKTLTNKGFNTFIYDSRAHGKSTGENCTYGFYEKLDVSDIIDELQEKYGPSRFALWGNSYGGAVGLQATATDARIELAVIESAFADLADIVYDYKKRISGIGIRWVSDRVLSRAGGIAHFDPTQVVPALAAKEIHVPVFMAHGDQDKNISVAYGKKNFSNLPRQDKELVIVKGAGHNDMKRVGGEAYLQKVFVFIDKHW